MENSPFTIEGIPYHDEKFTSKTGIILNYRAQKNERAKVGETISSKAQQEEIFKDYLATL